MSIISQLKIKKGTIYALNHHSKMVPMIRPSWCSCIVPSHNEQSRLIEQITVCGLPHQVTKALQFWLGHQIAHSGSNQLPLSLFYGGEGLLPQKKSGISQSSQFKITNISVKIFYSLRLAKEVSYFFIKSTSPYSHCQEI